MNRELIRMKLKNFGAALLIASTTLTSFASAAMAADVPSPNQYYWPKGMNLAKLRAHDAESDPYGADYYTNYHKKFEQLNLQEVRKDIEKVMLTSQPWWPADYGNYGPFFIRMAWHNAGTYRAIDGRGGEEGAQQRFAQLNDWPDNASLDKAKRLLWPVKKKYGEKLSWGDLIVLTGDVALNQMGFKTLGFVGGRPDDWQSELIYWGPGTTFFPNKSSFQVGQNGTLKHPLAATHMGLIYVNPEGPNGDPDPAKSAQMIRLAFGRMAMNDEETVALIAGGHTFGKAHGAHPNSCLSGPPVANGVEHQGLGWADHCIKGKQTADDASTSGLEGSWSADPIHFTTQYIDNLLNNDWVLGTSPTGAHQWHTKTDDKIAPDPANPNDPSKMRPIMMFTTDIALKNDPVYHKILARWAEHPNEFADAFARAWFKLVVRDMGPKSRYFGSEVPKETFVWQDPVNMPAKPINQADVRELRKLIAATGLSDRELIKTAWAAASSHRVTDHRGGANGGRLALMPQNGWAVNDPEELKTILPKLEKVRDSFNAHSARKVALADIIVLGGSVGIEDAAKKAGVKIQVPFAPGRGDATQDQTDVNSFNLLEPTADAFRNYYRADADNTPPLNALVDKADTLGLTIPEMTVLLGGLRTLDINTGHSANGVLTKNPGALSTDFFTNVLTMDTRWEKVAGQEDLYEGFDRASGQKQWTATDVDLVFGANPELRAVAEVYASNDGKAKFYNDFVKAWTKVMNLDRFDLQR